VSIDKRRVSSMVRSAAGLVLAGLALVTGGWIFLGRMGTGSLDHSKPEKPSDFAADREIEYFDAKRAMKYLEDICRIGPRISGSEGMKEQQRILEKHFEGLGGKIYWQRFTARQKSQPKPVELANLVVSWHPERQRRIILCSHYDTRPIADQEEKRSKWTEPFISANDGGSGVALLMEMGHVMKNLRVRVGVDFVFFDGEEYIFNPGPNGDVYFFGSEHFAQNYQKDPPRHRYAGAVLMDMIGGKNARFPIEKNSWIKAGDLVQELWTIAAEQKCAAFVNQLGPEVRDDHLALNRVRIPAVDIIDFDYPHWHRLSDIPANCSPDSLEQVARVLIVWLQRLN
jgi:glutaminyl-peptide cyclotransferase